MLLLPEKLLFALVLMGATAFFAVRGVSLYRLIRLGKPDADDRSADLRRNVVSMLADVLLQRQILRKPIVGVLHGLIVYGFIVFIVNTINHFTGAFIAGFNLFGNTIVARGYAATADVFAVLLIIGTGGLAVRRYILRPPSLTLPSKESAVVFASIIGAMAAYLWTTSHEIALGFKSHPESHIVANPISHLLTALPDGLDRVLAHVAWWSDGLLHLLLLGLMFYPTKHLHLFAGPVNLLFRRRRPRGRLSKIDLADETAETFGVSTIDGFTWKQNLDLFACIECGRCQDFCPTHHSGKPLNPKRLIVDLRDHLLEDGPTILSARSASGEQHTETPQLIGGIISLDTIWACTTCGACVEHCPMGIEHVDKIVDMRRDLTLMKSDIADSATTTFRNMETAGNPWGFPQSERGKWSDGLDVPVISEKGQAEILYWVGCSGSYDERNQRVSKAVVKILKTAGVDFAILGAEERCTCESARRLGNEYLYQSATEEVVATLSRYRFERILVTCPHCLNTLGNEYPDFGGNYTVVHHTQFINELIEQGRLKPDIAGSNADTTKAAFHDSCYLGRYNGVYEPPRQVLHAAGKALTAVSREREHGFCCGAGGGRMWMEETIGEPISGVRVRELLANGANEIVASCPFCITMLTEGAKRETNGTTSVLDVAEVIAKRIG